MYFFFTLPNPHFNCGYTYLPLVIMIKTIKSLHYLRMIQYTYHFYGLNVLLKNVEKIFVLYFFLCTTPSPLCSPVLSKKIMI